MLKPGEKTGPMALPVSYTKQQLEEYRWCSDKQEFLGKKSGSWGSRLNDGRWQGQGNRFRYNTRPQKGIAKKKSREWYLKNRK